MTRSLRIVVADDEPRMLQYFQKILPRLGHEVVGTAENGTQLVDRCARTQPDLVITDINMPELDGIDAANRICEQFPLPVILVSAHSEDALIRRAEADHILAYLVKPIKQADLEPAIAIAMRRFEQFQATRQEASDLRQALEDRKIIERAKGVLMKQTGVSEPDAFRRLQKMAMDRRCKLVQAADMILAAKDALKACL
jgi:two-component system, response regulator PdtaR